MTGVRAAAGSAGEADEHESRQGLFLRVDRATARRQPRHYLDIGTAFLDDAGNIPADVMSDALHPSATGYEIWARTVIEPLSRLMGTPVPAVD
jgi:lysophospholipase L1-like esterase